MFDDMHAMRRGPRAVGAPPHSEEAVGIARCSRPTERLRDMANLALLSAVLLAASGLAAASSTDSESDGRNKEITIQLIVMNDGEQTSSRPLRLCNGSGVNPSDLTLSPL